VEEARAALLLHEGGLRVGRGPVARRHDAGPAGREVRQRRKEGGQPTVLPCDPARDVRRHHHAPRRAGVDPQGQERRPGHLAPRHHRKAVRARPQERAGAERAAAQVLHRGPGLPHRSLPGQGDRAEPDGDALRQHDFRAHLEPQVHRSRADHGERDARRRHARRLLQPERRDARHGAEPHLPVAGAGRHGTAGRARCDEHPRREGEGVQGRPPDARQRGGGHDRPRTAPAKRTANGRPATAPRRTCQRTRQPRRSPR